MGEELSRPDRSQHWTAVLGDIGAALEKAFGAEFDIWHKDGSWKLVFGSGHACATPTEPAGVDIAPAADAAIDGAPQATQLSEGCCLLALPVHQGGRTPLVAAAVLDAPARLLLNMARLFLETSQQRTEIERYRKDLEICAAQIGDDFEELTFLRNLSEQLDISDGSHGAWQVAQLVLPLLSPLIQAEALVLFPAERHGKGPDCPLVVAAEAAVWVGPRRISEAACSRLVDCLKHSAAGHALVNNHFNETALGREYPAVHEVVLVPLVKGQQVLGWLLALNRAHRHVPRPDGARWELSDSEFGTVEASLLGSVASMLATHARNVELFREKEALLISVVRAMVSAIDAKDRYTCGHSERVALVGQRIGEQLGLGQRECERLYLTGLLHDVGKIGVSDAVLRKPGKLTDEEFAEIKRHPDQGWAILQNLDQLNYVFPGVLHHHENFDGSGYPDRLAGDGIPLVARILAVADAYDAMVSDRPYRKGMPHEKVETILRTGSGGQWDPQVVDAFFQALAEIRVLWQAYQPQIAHSRRLAAPLPSPDLPATAPVATLG